jgi:prepilin-type N-terminal cleavage/methylation domain-containing protein
MKRQRRSYPKGMTLIELMVVLVICCMLIGGIYRLFIAQSKAYTVQDQVVEVQQNVRAAMEILLRDLRMTGFDDDRTPLIMIPNPPVIPEDHAITVRYEYDNAQYQVRYWLDATSRLIRQETINGVSTTETLLENVEALNFTYGIDENEDGAMDDRDANGMIDDWVPSGTVGNLKVVAVRASLTARPTQVNADLQSTSPRTLISAVTFRNLSRMR